MVNLWHNVEGNRKEEQLSRQHLWYYGTVITTKINFYSTHFKKKKKKQKSWCETLKAQVYLFFHVLLSLAHTNLFLQWAWMDVFGSFF